MYVHSSSRTGRAGGVRAASVRFGFILAVHAAFVIVLLQTSPELRRQVAPVLVSMISSPPPAPVPEPAPMPSAHKSDVQPLKAAKPQVIQSGELEARAPTAITAEPSTIPEATLVPPSSVPAVGNVTSTAVGEKPAPAAATSSSPLPVVPPRFDAAYLNNPRPDYPRAAKRMGEQGKVTLRVLVSTVGSPEKIEIGISSGSRRLDDAARLAVEQWKFVPARQGDAPVAAWVIVPISFTLEG